MISEFCVSVEFGVTCVSTVFPMLSVFSEFCASLDCDNSRTEHKLHRVTELIKHREHSGHADSTELTKHREHSGHAGHTKHAEHRTHQTYITCCWTYHTAMILQDQ